MSQHPIDVDPIFRQIEARAIVETPFLHVAVSEQKEVPGDLVETLLNDSLALSPRQFELIRAALNYKNDELPTNATFKVFNDEDFSVGKFDNVDNEHGVFIPFAMTSFITPRHNETIDLFHTIFSFHADSSLTMSMGLFLGYPACCAEFGRQEATGEETIDDYNPAEHPLSAVGFHPCAQCAANKSVDELKAEIALNRKYRLPFPQSTGMVDILVDMLLACIPPAEETPVGTEVI